MKLSNYFKGQVQIWIASLLIATSFPVGEIIADELDPGILNLLRFIIAVIVYTPFIYLKYKYIFFPSFKKIISYSLISFCLTGFFWFMFKSLKYTTALNTGTLFVLIPGIAAIFSYFLLKEKLSSAKLLALLFGFVGAIWVVFRGDISSLLGMKINVGDLIFLCGCLLMAFYAPLVKKIHSGEPAAIISYWTLITGCGWLLIFSNFKLLEVDWSTISFSTFPLIAYLAIFTTILSTLFFQSAAINLGGNKVAAYTYLNPSLVVIINWIIGKGLPPFKVLPGVLIVLLATLILQKSDK